MPPEEEPFPAIVCEGDTDRTVLEGLAAKGVLRPTTIYPKRGERGGLTEQVKGIRALVNFGARGLIVARDLDEAPDGPALLRRLAHDLGAEAKVTSEQPPLLEFKGCKVALVPQGLPGDALMKKYSVARHAIDDFLLRLLEQSVGERPRLFSDEAARDRAFYKLGEVRELMVRQDYKVNKSKQLVFLLKAMGGYAVSDAMLARQLVEGTSEQTLRLVFKPLTDDVNASLQVLGCS